MKSVRLTDRSLAADGNRLRKHARYGWEFSELKIRITREDIENSDHEQRCGNCSSERLLNKIENAPSAKKNSPITTTSFQTTEIPKEWEEHGETTIAIIFRQHIGGAMEKKDLREWNEMMGWTTCLAPLILQDRSRFGDPP